MALADLTMLMMSLSALFEKMTVYINLENLHGLFRRFPRCLRELLRWCRFFRRFPEIGSPRRWQLRLQGFLRPLQESTRGRGRSKAAFSRSPLIWVALRGFR